MSLDFTQKIEKLLHDQKFSDEIQDCGWNFTLIDKHIIRFQPYGILNMDGYLRLSQSFFTIRKEYFAIEEFLILIFDFSKFKKASSNVRVQITDSEVFKDRRIIVVLFGTNYFVSTLAKIISNTHKKKRVYFVKSETESILLAKQFVSDITLKKVKEIQSSNYYSQGQNDIVIKGRKYTIRSRQAWTYNDPTSDYAYKIDIIDDNILISRPSGYIRYHNSIMANVLFDKVVNSELETGQTYYRIQDYTAVSGAENKARRDFTDYITRGIDNINLVVFYGLNRVMKTIVRLGKLVNPAFVKVRISDTFEDSLEQIIKHKYKNLGSLQETKLSSEDQTYKSPQEEILGLKQQSIDSSEENIKNINLLFDRISKIAFGTRESYEPVQLDENNPFYELFSAVQLLHEDYDELRGDRDDLKVKLTSFLAENTNTLKSLKIENAAKLSTKDIFIRNSGHELNLALDTLLKAIQLLRQEEPSKAHKPILEIIKAASIILQDGIAQLKSSNSNNYTISTLSESMFNYRKNISQLVEIARIGNYKGHIIFENKIDEALPTFIIGDKRKFNQIANIFIENALKFTHDGFIKLNTEVVKKTASQVTIKFIVEDSGIGIDKNKKPHIFLEDDLLNEEQANGGYGLRIAQELAKVLKAKIDYSSAVSVGSKFWIELTFNIGYHDKISQMTSVRDQRKPKPKNEFPLEGKNILLIIDGEIQRNLMQQLIMKNGGLVRAKLNYEFVENIAAEYDFVFLDLNLEGGTELQNFKLLKKQLDKKSEAAKPLYIAIVDSTTNPIMEEYRKYGIDYFIRKSFQSGEFDQLIKDLK